VLLDIFNILTYLPRTKLMQLVFLMDIFNDGKLQKTKVHQKIVLFIELCRFHKADYFGKKTFRFPQ
jgi:hypothetical protein